MINPGVQSYYICAMRVCILCRMLCCGYFCKRNCWLQCEQNDTT